MLIYGNRCLEKHSTLISGAESCICFTVVQSSDRAREIKM